MLNYVDLVVFMEDNNIPFDSPIKVIHRETAMSDIEHLDIVVNGNNLTAFRGDESNRKHVLFGNQMNIMSVMDLFHCKALSDKAKRERVINIYEVAFRSDEIMMSYMLDGLFSTEIHVVRKFYYHMGIVMIDLKRKPCGRQFFYKVSD